jgi:RHS repeat-associated protein
VSFGSNALGQRVSKTSGSGTVLFAYDEQGHLIGEYGPTGSLIEETVWLGDIPVATLRPGASGGVDIYYVDTDRLDTPRAVTQATDNTVVWRWSSDPYGNGFGDEDPESSGQLFVYNLRFPGQYYDSEAGLVYNYRRDYDPQLGRDIESDPIGLARGSFSTYAYVGDDPTNAIDAFGLIWKAVGTKYYTWHNVFSWWLNRWIGALNEGLDHPTFAGANPEEYDGARRDLIQEWVHDPEHPKRDCEHPIGSKRTIRQTFGKTKDVWQISGYSYTWLPVVASPTYNDY